MQIKIDSLIIRMGDKMKTKIQIERSLCNGCGKCIQVCQNNVLQLINGRVHVINEKRCNVFGRCIQFCDQNAISIVEKTTFCEGPYCSEIGDSELYNWPVQITSVNVNNRHFPDSDLLIAADCTAYAYADFHNDFIKDHVTLIACPKNDLSHHLLEKLTLLFSQVSFRSISVVAMNAQCCAPLLETVREAVKLSQCGLSVSECVISAEGEVFR